MPDDARLTVAIPTFNGERHLAEALAGVLGQLDAACELLVSDDRSDDGSVALVRAMAGDRARVVIHPDRLGLARNWNRCVELSRTEWVAIFHQDDVMKAGDVQGRLEVIRRGADVHPGIGMIYGPADVVDVQGWPVAADVVERGVESMPGAIPDDFVYAPPGAAVGEWSSSNPVRCSTVTLRKSAHEALGGFDPSYRYVVDWEFWLRLARDYGVARRTGPATVAVRWHEASETHRFKVGVGDLEETERLLATLSPSRAATRRLARAYLNRAYDAARAGRRDLLRRSLVRAFRIDPSIWATLAADPRLVARLGLGLLRRNPDSKLDDAAGSR